MMEVCSAKIIMQGNTNFHLHIKDFLLNISFVSYRQSIASMIDH